MHVFVRLRGCGCVLVGGWLAGCGWRGGVTRLAGEWWVLIPVART